jgi:prepilin signal peptidase PulO-like enzyme (type II secretory pathway)
MDLVFFFLGAVKNVVTAMAPAMPLDFWWVTALVLVLLALTATVDAFTSIVPDIFIFIGLVAVTSAQGLGASWSDAAQHLEQAIAAGVLIWAINALWHKKFKHDALGMGDAKWTMLAVACFGIMPAVFAWGVGSLLAVSFIGAAKLGNYTIRRVTFAPFLFVGLIAGLFWLRFFAPTGL